MERRPVTGVRNSWLTTWTWIHLHRMAAHFAVEPANPTHLNTRASLLSRPRPIHPTAPPVVFLSSGVGSH